MNPIIQKPNNRRNRRSFFINMLVSNCLLLLLPIIIGLVLYNRTEYVMKSNAERANAAMLEQLRLSMDSKFKEIQQLSQQIVLNPKLGYLLEADKKDASQQYRSVQFMWDYMNIYRNISSGFINDFYIFINKSDTIIKPNVVTDSHTFYDRYYRFEGLSYEAWRKQLSTYHNQTYLPSSTLFRNGHIEGTNLNDSPLRIITFLQSLPIHDSTEVKGSLVILVDESKIQEMTRQVESANKSSVYIVNREHQIISGTAGTNLLPDQFLKQLKTDSGLFDYHLDGQDTTVSYTTSKQVGWYYIAVMPTVLYMQKVKQIERLAMWLFLLCIIVGIIAAYGVAYRNYFPIKRTVDAIASGLRQPRKPTFNELEFIMERLELSWNEERHVKNKLSQQMPLIRANYLQRLIQGYLELPDQMEQSLAFMDVRFPHQHFAVVLVHVESLSQFAPDQSEKQWALARFIITNLAEDLTDMVHCIYTVELAKNRLALLINLDVNMLAHPTNGLRDIVAELNRLLETRFKLSTVIAVSGVHKGWQQVGEAYLEANVAIEYQVVKGQQSIFYFNDIRQEKLQYYYPVETELQLINCIRSGEKEQAITLLYNLYEKNFCDESITPELGRCLIISLAGTLLRILIADTPVYRELVEGDIHPIRALLSCKTTDEMFEKVKELYLIAAESFNSERRDHSEQLLQKIESFIHNHFADSNMSLNMLSEHLQLTPQYLSQFYKKASGSNLNDYLTQVRLERAKQIMMDPQLTNAQIAKMIGYTKDTVFIRVFKKVEGVTPGKYRESVTK